MDVDSDTGLLVVDLEHCVPTDIRSIDKNGMYSNAASENCHNVIQLVTPVQCLSDTSETICRIPHHSLTQLQPIHYQHIQVNYDGSNPHGLSPLYHPADLQTFSHSQGYSSPLLSTLSTVDQSPIQVTPPSPPPVPPPPPPPLPPPPKERRKRNITRDSSDVPHFPINDCGYYKEIEQLLVNDKYPDGVSENYKNHLRKRARHYLIIDNVLHHNPKKPKKVVMRKLEQMNLLESIHVTPDTGIHLGIKKMLDLIHGEYFWRGLYEDVANFVKSCPKCRDNVDLAQRREKEFRRLGEDFSDDEMEFAYATTAVQTIPIVWTKVEIQLHGPFKVTECRNEYVVTITDPESCFVHASPLSRDECATKLTDFVVKTFYTFGFPQPTFIGDKKLYEEISAEYDIRLKQTAWKTKLLWKENSNCPWVSQLVELLIVRKADRWDKEMDKFMFQFRTGCIRHSPSPKDSAPFYSMFQRLPYIDDKENTDLRTRGRIHLQCYDCDDVFTSKVALKLHRNQHAIEEARKTSILEYAIEKQESEGGEELKKSRVEAALSEIKNYLEKTKDIRRKRGKYQKYSVDLQEQMIAYANKHGIRQASVYFTQLIGSNVSDSTIRNLLKASVHFSPRIKEEIARYAIEHGLDKASKHFTETLKKEVHVSLVKKFKILYGGKFVKQDKENSGKSKSSKIVKNISDLSEEEKEAICNYSCHHSLRETIDFYFRKLNVKLCESDIYEFQKVYLNKQTKNEFIEIQTENDNIANVTYQTLPHGSVCFSPSGSIVQIQDSSYNYQDINYHTPPKELENVKHHEKSGDNCSVLDNLLTVPRENSSTACEVSKFGKQGETRNSAKEQNTKCQRNPKETIDESFHVQLPTSFGETSVPQVAEKNSFVTCNQERKSSYNHQKHKPSKKGESTKKRGTYAAYSPELRAKIGKYAAEHGKVKASIHFSKILGHDLPESTVRGFKERYLKKVRHCDVTSLGYCNRGRPLRLGKYDEVVQECLKELVQSGERITSFLAITTAKQLLNKLEPGLLKENGGSVVLNNTWAKSILKRIGVRNNS